MSLNNYEEKLNNDVTPEETEEEVTPSPIDLLEGKVKKCEEGLLDAMKGVKKDFDLDRSRIDEFDERLSDLEGVIAKLNDKLGDDDLLLKIKPTAWDKAHPSTDKPIGSPVEAYTFNNGSEAVINEDLEALKRQRTILKMNDSEIYPTWAWKYKAATGGNKYVELTKEEATALGLI